MSEKTPLEMLIGDEAQLRRRLGELEARTSEHQRWAQQTITQNNRRLEALEQRLTAEFALVKAMCNAVDWDTAEAKGVGVALSPSARSRPVEPEPARDFPCCERLQDTLIIGSAYVRERFHRWCPYIDAQATTVLFRESGKFVCLACGDSH